MLNRPGRSFRAVLAAGLLAGVFGCNRLAWEKKTNYRLDHIRRESLGFARHDAGGPGRMHAVIERGRRLHAHHKEHFRKTTALVGKELESDRQRWRDQRSKRRLFASRHWRGNPSSIPNTWAKMVY